MPDAASAPKKIPPEMLQPICNAIGDQFSFGQLDAIIYRCFGDHKINGYASPNAAPRAIAYECVTKMENEGLALIFLAYILTLVQPNSELYTKIVTALPEAKTTSQVKFQVPAVLEGLQHARAKISDAAVKSALMQSKSALELMQRGITLLDCYKSLHDCLHGIQLRQFAALLASVRTVTSDPAQLPSLREYQDQVRAAVVSAQTIVQRLPDEVALRSIEDKWIGELDEAVKIYRKALDDRDSSKAKIAVIKLSIVLRSHSPRLNDLIVAAARGLPLGALSKALGDVSGNGSTQFLGIDRAKEALMNLESSLRGRVLEHDMWQGVDKGIWYLDELFGQSADPIEDFTAFWPEVSAPSRTLAYLSPGAEWSTSLLEYSTRVDTELLRLDPAKRGPCSEQPPKSSLGSMFADFRSEARHQFFVVDQLLKQDCGVLIGIGTPVEQILRDLHDA